MHQNSPLEGGR